MMLIHVLPVEFQAGLFLMYSPAKVLVLLLPVVTAMPEEIIVVTQEV